MNRHTLVRWRPALLAALALTACGGGNAPQMVNVQKLAPGAECALGGVELQSGEDKNKNGKLDADEVASSERVCTTPDTLVVTTRLLPNDAACVNGGTRLDTGADDGAGGGTAGDGVLQSGEIDSTQYLCNEKQGVAIEPYAPPEGPAGAFTIDARGGRGTDGSGGTGGSFTAELDKGSLGGHVKVFRTGLADASWQPPSSVSTFLGRNPLVVESAAVIKQVPVGDRSGLAAGDLFVEPTSARWDRSPLRRWTGTTEEAVTGIEVRPGATLTLQPASGSDRVNVAVPNDIRVAGKVTSALLNDGASRATVVLAADTYLSLPGSVVDLRGVDGVDGASGGNGGAFYVYATDTDYSLEQVFGLVLNQGRVDTSGGSGAFGGSAGAIELWAESAASNTAPLLARGGTGQTANGGNGAYIGVECDYGHDSNGGELDASGGAGAIRGGNAGSLSLYVGYPGDLRNTGRLLARGGDAAASCTSGCAGGQGGRVDYYVYGGKILNAADIDLRGGAGAAGPGGTGGTLEVGASWDNGWGEGWIPIDDVMFSGNITTRGGDGTSGGDAGPIGFYLDCSDLPRNQEIVLLGYTDVRLGGGDGKTGGGSAGGFTLYNAQAGSNWGDGTIQGAGGGVFNYAHVHAQGGSSEEGPGGEGGGVSLRTDEQWGFDAHGMLAHNYGNLELSGGNGTVWGGSAGGVTLFGPNGVVSSGTITAVGGSASAPSGRGGGVADSIKLFADLGTVELTGNITTGGGQAPGVGGMGGNAPSIQVVGNAVNNSAALRATGGDANTTDGTGGQGNAIFLYGIMSGTTNTSTSLNARGGQGSTPGKSGEVFIDNQNVSARFDVN